MIFFWFKSIPKAITGLGIFYYTFDGENKTFQNSVYSV